MPNELIFWKGYLLVLIERDAEITNIYFLKGISSQHHWVHYIWYTWNHNMEKCLRSIQKNCHNCLFLEFSAINAKISAYINMSQNMAMHTKNITFEPTPRCVCSGRAISQRTRMELFWNYGYRTEHYYLSGRKCCKRVLYVRRGKCSGCSRGQINTLLSVPLTRRWAKGWAEQASTHLAPPRALPIRAAGRNCFPFHPAGHRKMSSGTTHSHSRSPLSLFSDRRTQVRAPKSGERRLRNRPAPLSPRLRHFRLIWGKRLRNNEIFCHPDWKLGHVIDSFGWALSAFLVWAANKSEQAC